MTRYAKLAQLAAVGFGLLMVDVPAPSYVQRTGAADVSIPIDTHMDPPRWAVLQRQLLADNVPACQEFFNNTSMIAGTCSASCVGAPMTGPTMRSRISIVGPSFMRWAPATKSFECIRRDMKACCVNSPVNPVTGSRATRSTSMPGAT